MDITHAGLRKNASVTPQADAPDVGSQAHDISFFTAQMNHTEQPVRAIASTMASPSLSGGSPESDTLSRRVSKGFRDASLSKKTKDANEFPQALAEAHIDVMSRVKVIGALAKGVDKISNMG